MKISTYHAHSTFSDGNNTAEEMVLSAIECGCPEIGLSDHSPIAGLEWPMPESRVDEYIETLAALREKYKSKIKVYTGIELDTYSDTPKQSFDYILGSVHAVMTAGGRRDVDVSADFARETVDKYFGGDPYAYCEAYYDEVSSVYEKTKCDIIGHFDLITKFIERDPLFSEAHPRYIAARDRALEKLLLTPALFEINTGAISRGYRISPYPRPDVIRRIAAAGKPFVITSDSHSAESVNCELEEVASSLKEQGIPFVTTLEEVLKITRK